MRTISNIIEEINLSPLKVYFATTGGGFTFLDKYMGEGGGSQTLLGAQVPYNTELLRDFIGAIPEKCVSKETAFRMAHSALKLIVDKAGPDETAVGIGCTVSLGVKDQRVGRFNGFHLAFEAGGKALHIHGTFREDDRQEQETELFYSVLFGLSKLGMVKMEIRDYIRKTDISIREFQAPDQDSFKSFSHFNLGVLCNSEVTKKILAEDEVVIFPGSFNPIHDGHIKMMKMAEEITGKRPVLEISTINVDKPEMNFLDIYERHSSLSNYPLVFTKHPFLSDKVQSIAREFPAKIQKNGFDKKITLVLGWDTWVRFATNAHRDNSTFRHHKSFHENVSFLVFNRGGEMMDDNKYVFKNVTFIKGFSMDISSTQIRNSKNED